MQTGVRSGILLMVVGLWLVLSSTRRDDSQRTLIDHITGKAATWTAGVAPAGRPGSPLAALQAAPGGFIPASAANASPTAAAQAASPNPTGVAAHGGTF